MQTKLSSEYQNTPDGRAAEAILRKCVHCGFCTATCPSYQILGDELDSPRGRIYLMKQVLEGVAPTRKTQVHLDRCLDIMSKLEFRPEAEEELKAAVLTKANEILAAVQEMVKLEFGSEAANSEMARVTAMVNQCLDYLDVIEGMRV